MALASLARVDLVTRGLRELRQSIMVARENGFLALGTGEEHQDAHLTFTTRGVSPGRVGVADDRCGKVKGDAVERQAVRGAALQVVDTLEQRLQLLRPVVHSAVAERNGCRDIRSRSPREPLKASCTAAVLLDFSCAQLAVTMKPTTRKLARLELVDEGLLGDDDLVLTKVVLLQADLLALKDEVTVVQEVRLAPCEHVHQLFKRVVLSKGGQEVVHVEEEHDHELVVGVQLVVDGVVEPVPFEVCLEELSHNVVDPGARSVTQTVKVSQPLRTALR